MNKIIDNNKISTSNIEIPAKGKLSEIAVLKAIRPSYQLDANGKRTNIVDFYRMDCIDPKSYSSFTLKVLSTNEVISAEELEDATEVVYVKIPLNEVNIRPYKIEYGMATVSITVPHVQLVTNSKEVK